MGGPRWSSRDTVRRSFRGSLGDATRCFEAAPAQRFVPVLLPQHHQFLARADAVAEVREFAVAAPSSVVTA